MDTNASLELLCDTRDYTCELSEKNSNKAFHPFRVGK